MAKYASNEFKCVVCLKPGADLHHIKTRKSGGPDESWNLLPICHAKHVEAHSIGLIKLADRYPAIKAWLLDNGWLIEQGKWRHFD